jgi:hypothetical protein
MLGKGEEGRFYRHPARLFSFINATQCILGSLGRDMQKLAKDLAGMRISRPRCH